MPQSRWVFCPKTPKEKRKRQNLPRSPKSAASRPPPEPCISKHEYQRATSSSDCLTRATRTRTTTTSTTFILTAIVPASTRAKASSAFVKDPYIPAVSSVTCNTGSVTTLTTAVTIEEPACLSASPVCVAVAPSAVAPLAIRGGSRSKNRSTVRSRGKYVVPVGDTNTILNVTDPTSAAFSFGYPIFRMLSLASSLTSLFTDLLAGVLEMDAHAKWRADLRRLRPSSGDRAIPRVVWELVLDYTANPQLVETSPIIKKRLSRGARRALYLEASLLVRQWRRLPSLNPPPARPCINTASRRHV